MKLMTAGIANALYEADVRMLKADGRACNDSIIVKYFNPCGAATWYITSGTPLDANGIPTTPDRAADWHLFGLCDLHNDGGEMGYVLLSDLQSLRLPWGLTIERDLSYTGTLTGLRPEARYELPQPQQETRTI